MEKPKRQPRTLKGKYFGFTEEQSQLIALMMKLLMQTVQGQKDVMGAVFDTWLAPSKDTLILAMTFQGRRYAHQVKEPGHGLASPHLYVFAALLKAISDLALDLLEKVKYEDYEKMTLEEKCQVIRLCKQAKTYDDEVKKLALAFGSGPTTVAYKERVLAVPSKKSNWTYKMGRAPPSYMERELTKFLQDMVS